MPHEAGHSATGDTLQPGTLLERARRAHTHALAAGALRPIAAAAERVYDNGIAFTVWRLAHPDMRLPADRAQPDKPAWSETDANPFLPYDPAMFVADITDTHVCLLNKYNVLDDHLLLVTRAFELQSTWLTRADFEALRICRAEFDGLAFYNGGRTAGASQRHKHLQYVSLPLAPHETELAIAAAIRQARWSSGIGNVEAFPFLHALGRLDLDATADSLQRIYRRLLDAAGIALGDGDEQTAPYNLLAARDWMLIVPRREESYRGVSVNALGFAGSLLVRDEGQLRQLRDIGPLSILAHVGVSAA